MCIQYIFIKTFKKSSSSFLAHVRRGVWVWVKIRLKALAKTTFGMSPGVIQTCFQHRKLYFLGTVREHLLIFRIEVMFQNTHQAYDPSDLIIEL